MNELLFGAFSFGFTVGVLVTNFAVVRPARRNTDAAIKQTKEAIEIAREAGRLRDEAVRLLGGVKFRDSQMNRANGGERDAR